MPTPLLPARPWFASSARRLTSTTLLSAALMGSLSAQAAPVVVPAKVVPSLTSNAERMISYRHEEHMWQTSDGALHIMINRGTLTPNQGLQLYTSTDNGANWVLTASTGSTGPMSTSDGVLVGDTLTLVYNNTNNVIVQATLNYNATTKTWGVVSTGAVFASSGIAASNPAIAFDSVGNAWVTYVTQNTANGNYGIRMSKRSAGGSTFVDTGLVFGPVDTTSIERSARPVAINNGMGMVFAVHDKVYWATRANALPDNSAWTTSQIYTHTPDGGLDPYASHFNLAQDGAGNVHMCLVDDGNVNYLRYAARTSSWNATRVLSSDGQAAYCQTSIVDGSKVQISFNVGGKVAKTLVSTNTGVSFTLGYLLTHPAAVEGTTYGYARLETPTRVSSPAPMMQQYVVNGEQRLMLFQQGAATAP